MGILYEYLIDTYKGDGRAKGKGKVRYSMNTLYWRIRRATGTPLTIGPPQDNYIGPRDGYRIQNAYL